EGIGPGVGNSSNFVHVPPRGRDLCLLGSTVSHAKEPTAQRNLRAQRTGLAIKDQEGGLKGVLRIVLVIQDATTQAQDHGAVPADQRYESTLLTLVAEKLQ